MTVAGGVAYGRIECDGAEEPFAFDIEAMAFLPAINATA
jgi:hypothetical protein